MRPESQTEPIPGVLPVSIHQLLLGIMPLFRLPASTLAHKSVRFHPRTPFSVAEYLPAVAAQKGWRHLRQEIVTP